MYGVDTYMWAELSIASSGICVLFFICLKKKEKFRFNMFSALLHMVFMSFLLEYKKSKIKKAVNVIHIDDPSCHNTLQITVSKKKMKNTKSYT